MRSSASSTAHASASLASATLLGELLFLALNAILFQRALYARSQFRRARKWELPVIVSSNPGVVEYLTIVVAQIQRLWLTPRSTACSLNGVALVILDEANRAVERWHFHLASNLTPQTTSRFSEKADLQRLMRQIGTTVSFLPLLRGKHTFRIAISEHSRNSEFPPCPADFAESPGRIIEASESGEFHTVRLHDFVVKLTVDYSVDLALT